MEVLRVPLPSGARAAVEIITSLTLLLSAGPGLVCVAERDGLLSRAQGEVEDIERERSTQRGKGRTEVIVDEGINTVSYALDETLIEFGTRRSA